MLNKSVCNSKEKWDHHECRCESKKLDDWSSCKDAYMWNHITCNFECNKACKTVKCLDNKNFSSEKCLLANLILTDKYEM